MCITYLWLILIDFFKGYLGFPLSCSSLTVTHIPNFANYKFVKQ